MSTQHPISPRDYAALILAEPDRQRRGELLRACPENWRPIVETHVTEGFAAVRAYRQQMRLREQSMRAGTEPAPRVSDTDFRISDFHKSEPEVGNSHLSRIRAALTAEAKYG